MLAYFIRTCKLEPSMLRNSHVFGHLGNVVGKEFQVAVLMDSAPIHHNAEMNSDSPQIRKLPLYSPMPNIIEHVFSCLKAPVKRIVNERMADTLDRNLPGQQNLPLTTYRTNILQNFSLNQFWTKAPPSLKIGIVAPWPLFQQFELPKM